ncbi:hypothetical protein HC864_02855 [Candidatus Gracilibacteria bacterium]|nr:hypothetical protein [Candidatus Gracilibacteria bacterium]
MLKSSIYVRNLALIVGDKGWIKNNLDVFSDEEILDKILVEDYYVDEVESIEMLVYNRIVDRVNFLPAQVGEYQKLEKVLKSWYSFYGQSDLFGDIIKHIKSLYPRRRALMKLVGGW